MGESRKCKSNIRIIMATNKDLKFLVDQGKFREDLYYQLNVELANAFARRTALSRASILKYMKK